jgi:hypothetical protein
MKCASVHSNDGAFVFNESFSKDGFTTDTGCLRRPEEGATREYSTFSRVLQVAFAFTMTCICTYLCALVMRDKTVGRLF